MDELDGEVVAPEKHKVIFENDEVRVLETTIAAGDVTPSHTHLAPQVMYVLSGSHFIRRDEHGATMVDARSNPDFVLPKVLYSASLPRHTIENTGADALVVIGVELKHPRGGCLARRRGSLQMLAAGSAAPGGGWAQVRGG